MTENEAIEVLKQPCICEYDLSKTVLDCDIACCDKRDAVLQAIKALEEIQQYRALGTVEELRNAKEKQIPKKPVEKEMPYSEEAGFNSEWHCPCCDSYIGFFTEGMSEPEQMEYCNNCGQHIAKDWSDSD